MQFVIAISLLFGMMLGDRQACMSEALHIDTMQAPQAPEMQALYVLKKPEIVDRTTEPLTNDQTTEPSTNNQATVPSNNDQATVPSIIDQTTECWDIVRCRKYEDYCRIRINSGQKCLIIGDDTDADLATLYIKGTFAELPYAINKFKNLTKLSVVLVLLETVERAKLAPFRGIQTLDLSYNSITELGGDPFDDLMDLSSLDLQYNRLKTIHRDAFQKLRNLEFLDLGSNQLEILPDGLFANNQKLERIFLNGNKIHVLHQDAFTKLHNLTVINLSYNQLDVLADGLFRHNQKLESVSLSGNKIKQLHRDAFKDLPILQEIYLASNQLEILSDGLFRDNQKFHTLWLQENMIRKIECKLYELPHLTYLQLKRNACIDEECDVTTTCETSSMIAMHTIIQNRCRIDSYVCSVTENSRTFNRICHDPPTTN